MRDFASSSQRGVVETYKGRDGRLQFFYLPIAIGFTVLAIGLVYQQVLRSDEAHELEKVQSQRRILVPGPRGNIYDREGRILVGNQPRFSAVLYLDELRTEIWNEELTIQNAYRETNADEIPTLWQIKEIARFTVVDRYLQKVNSALGRTDELKARSLRNHFNAQRILPYSLVEDLKPEEYSRLLEQLPVNSPLQVYTTSNRYYPHGAAAAHVLGFVSANRDFEVDEAFPGADVTTYKMVGAGGRDGLESQFEEHLQGQAGGTIYRVDPGGYRVESLQRQLPVQGDNLVTSLDIDMQIAAESLLREYELAGAAVALDVNTGEVLVMASVPDYDLNDFAPSLSQAVAADINARGAWINRSVTGLYPPGSSFKILITLAGMRAGIITPESETDCGGYYRVGRRLFPCHDGHAHGEISLHTAISKSCNVYFYDYGLQMGADTIAAEARRFGFGARTAIDLPHETGGSLVPSPAWKKEQYDQSWVPGDTANLSIGQGYMLVTPLQMATFTASLARGQTRTVPHMVHDPKRPVQRTELIGLSPSNYAGILAGMEECTLTGSARSAFNIPSQRIDGLRVAGKTGTAQKRTAKGTINFAWFICFAPIENPQIAIAVMVEGDQPGEETGGGTFSAPVAHDILKIWAQKHPDLIPQPASKTAATR